MPFDYRFDAEVVSCPEGRLYTIRAGDTLYALARRFGITVDAIIAANPGIDPVNLSIGQQICIPMGLLPGLCPSGTTLYIIQAGDTLYRLAQRFNVSVEAIISVNPGIDPQFLQIGQRICIPIGVMPRTCTLVLIPRSDGPAPGSGGVFWMRIEDDTTTEGLVAATNLPSPQNFGANQYIVSLTWGRTSFDFPLNFIPAEPETWAAAFSGSFPAEFFRFGSVDILLNGRVVMGGIIEDCR